EGGSRPEVDRGVKAVEAVLERLTGETFSVPGLSIDVSHTEPPALQALADRAALRDQKDRLERELKQLKTQHAVAVDRNASKAQAEARSEEHTSELQSRENLVCRLLLEK